MSMWVNDPLQRGAAVSNDGWCRRMDVHTSVLGTGESAEPPSPIEPALLDDRRIAATRLRECSPNGVCTLLVDGALCRDCCGVTEPSVVWRQLVRFIVVCLWNGLPDLVVSLVRQGHSLPVLKHGPKESAACASVEPIWYWARAA